VPGGEEVSMRDVQPARSLWVALGVLGLSACDSTVGLDSTKLSFSGLLVPGVCKDQDDLQFADMSVMLLDSQDALLPDSRIRGQTGRVGDVLTEQNFEFVPPTGVNPSELQNKEAIAESDPEAADHVRLPLGLHPESLKFLWNGGEDRKDDDRLIILLMDQSGSIIGQDPNTGNVDTSRASDLDDARILFMRELINDLPEHDFVSLVWFNGTFPTFDPQYASPARNRSVTDAGLGVLSRGQDGGTPLVAALDQTMDRIVDFQDNADLNPVVVLFTDGTEAGDTTPNGKTLDDVIAKYATHKRKVGDETVDAPVPVIVMHLQVPAAAAQPPTSFHRGRDPKLAELACATGGEYLFLRDANEFTANPDLSTVVRNRLRGVWRLRVQTELAKPDFASGTGYLLTGELSATLGKNTNSFPFELSTDQTGGQDTRLWLYKK
jgi:hypothetical protein